MEDSIRTEFEQLAKVDEAVCSETGRSQPEDLIMADPGFQHLRREIVWFEELKDFVDGLAYSFNNHGDNGFLAGATNPEKEPEPVRGRCGVGFGTVIKAWDNGNGSDTVIDEIHRSTVRSGSFIP